MCLSVREGPRLNALGLQGSTIFAVRVFTHSSKRLINASLKIVERNAVFAYECVREFGGASEDKKATLHPWSCTYGVKPTCCSTVRPHTLSLRP